MSEYALFMCFLYVEMVFSLFLMHKYLILSKTTGHDKINCHAPSLL